MNMNTSALSSISATINGEARLVDTESEEEKWCKERHLENNTFGDQPREGRSLFGQTPNTGNAEGDGGTSYFIDGDDVRVLLVEVREGRIADWKGGVKDWTLSPTIREDETRGRLDHSTLTNGVR